MSASIVALAFQNALSRQSSLTQMCSDQEEWIERNGECVDAEVAEVVLNSRRRLRSERGSKAPAYRRFLPMSSI